MYNNDSPARVELPSSQQLFKSTFYAAVAALVLFVGVVLPAEYAIDPTGIGRVLRLTEMGEIKQQLAAEATADALVTATATGPAAAPGVPKAALAMPAEPLQAQALVAVPAPASEVWRDENSFTLKPGEGREIKLKMISGDKAQFSWTVSGGEVNFDTHADAPGQSISYEKGRGVAKDEGVLQAAFTGNHGWFWRNRGQSDVVLVLRTRGDYSEIKK